jgi:hypothetical protein
MCGIEQMGALGEATIRLVKISDSRRGPVKTIGFWMLPCLLSMAAYGAAEKPATLPAPAQVSAQGGSTSILAAYVFLHQTRYDSVPGDASARLKACHERKMQTAQPGEAK